MFIPHPHAIRHDDFARYADDRRISRDIDQNDRACPDFAIFTDCNGTEHFRPRSDKYIIAESRVALSFFLASPAQRNTLIQCDIIADFTRFSYDDSHAMVDEETPDDRRARMDFNACEKAADL